MAGVDSPQIDLLDQLVAWRAIRATDAARMPGAESPMLPVLHMARSMPTLLASPRDGTPASANRRLLYKIAIVGSLNFQGRLWIVYLRSRGYDTRRSRRCRRRSTWPWSRSRSRPGCLATTSAAAGCCSSAVPCAPPTSAILAVVALPGLVLAAFVAYGVGLALLSGAELALLVDSAEPDDDGADRADAGTTRVVGRYFALVTTGVGVGLALGGALHELSYGPPCSRREPSPRASP